MEFIEHAERTAHAQADDEKIEAVFLSKDGNYIVEKHFISHEPPFGHRLAIKRNDKTTIRSWRILQDIKNAIVGENAIAVEIYPEESEVTDTANMYHLWVFVNGYGPKVKLIPPDKTA